MAFIPTYVFILFTTILVDYIAGIYIGRSSGRVRKVWLWGSIIVTCAILFVFKYYDFFIGSFTSVATLMGWNIGLTSWNIILPIGLSFHTFQSLSYVIEVYRGNQKSEPNLIRYSTYVMFFPQLVAGPIERPQNLLHQFSQLQPFNEDRVISGLKRMAWGFFKKLVVADRLALYVNDVYGNPEAYNGLQLTLGTIFFAYQIYCDFSGYSDIAIGSARILGFKLMENFDSPYHSLSVSEFWRRWHISLSTWFKDYVYFPLGGNRATTLVWMRNILITFGVSGLWHGANWTYVCWGLLNGVYLIFGQITKAGRDSLMGKFGLRPSNPLRKLVMLSSTFTLTCVAWVIFRAQSLPDAWYIFTNFCTAWDFDRISTPNFLLRQLPLALVGILLLETWEILKKRIELPLLVTRLPFLPRWSLYLALVLGVVMFGVYRKSQFIYFQF